MEFIEIIFKDVETVETVETIFNKKYILIKVTDPSVIENFLLNYQIEYILINKLSNIYFLLENTERLEKCILNYISYNENLIKDV